MVELFSRAQREADEARRRERGEHIDPLTEEAPGVFRTQLIAGTERIFGSAMMDATLLPNKIAEIVVPVLREEYGLTTLSEASGALRELNLFIRYRATAHEIMDVINFTLHVGRTLLDRFIADALERDQIIENFVNLLKLRMEQNRMAYDIVNDQVVAKSDEEMHQAVVVPALTLLHNRPRFKSAETNYRQAITRLQEGQWSGAITSAQGAVEVVLRTYLGHEQGTLNSLLGTARKNGLFDTKREQHINTFINGLRALGTIRDQESDSHGNETDRDAAWLAVHWSGALVVYLVERIEKTSAS